MIPGAVGKLASQNRIERTEESLLCLPFLPVDIPSDERNPSLLLVLPLLLSVIPNPVRRSLGEGGTAVRDLLLRSNDAKFTAKSSITSPLKNNSAKRGRNTLPWRRIPA